MQIRRILLRDGTTAVVYSSTELDADLLQLRATASFADDPETARGFITMVVRHIAFNAGGEYHDTALMFSEDQSLSVSEKRLAQKFQYFERSVHQIAGIAISSRGKYWNRAIVALTEDDMPPLDALRHSIRQTKIEEAKRKAEEESHNPKHGH